MLAKSLPMICRDEIISQGSANQLFKKKKKHSIN